MAKCVRDFWHRMNTGRHSMTLNLNTIKLLPKYCEQYSVILDIFFKSTISLIVL